MKELLQKYKCTSAYELYSVMRMNYFDGHTITATEKYMSLEPHKQAEFISSMSPYDPAYQFFSTLKFTEQIFNY